MIPDYHTSRGRFAIFIEDQPMDSSLYRSWNEMIFCSRLIDLKLVEIDSLSQTLRMYV